MVRNMDNQKMDASAVPAYIADASAAVANRVTLTGVTGISLGWLFSQQGAIVVGVLAAIIGMIWTTVAGFQRNKEHALRMRWLSAQIAKTEHETVFSEGGD